MVTPLRKARLAKDLTLTSVADALNIEKGSLSRIETGRSAASPKLAARLAAYLGNVSEIEILYPARFVEQKRQRGRATA